eukprot:COSAG04_NODE_26937_length_289_cov_0.300000_1_plen_21_part_10
MKPGPAAAPAAPGPRGEGAGL